MNEIFSTPHSQLATSANMSEEEVWCLEMCNEDHDDMVSVETAEVSRDEDDDAGEPPFRYNPADFKRSLQNPPVPILSLQDIQRDIQRDLMEKPSGLQLMKNMMENGGARDDNENVDLAEAAINLDISSIYKVLGDEFWRMSDSEMLANEELFPHQQGAELERVVAALKVARDEFLESDIGGYIAPVHAHKKPRKGLASPMWFNVQPQNDERPVVLRLTEKIDIPMLLAFAGSDEGKKQIKEFKDINPEATDDELGWRDTQTVREVTFRFLRNVNHEATYEVEFVRSPIDQMLFAKGYIKESRLYALKTPGKNYPFSVTQLPRCLKAVALGKNFQQMDDSNAFQRIVFQHTSVQSVKDQINELIDGKEQVYDQILSQGDFKSRGRSLTMFNRGRSLTVIIII